MAVQKRSVSNVHNRTDIIIRNFIYWATTLIEGWVWTNEHTILNELEKDIVILVLGQEHP